MVAATGGKRVSVDVSGPMGEKVNGFMTDGDGKTAIIEMAAASGLMLVAPGGALRSIAAGIQFRHRPIDSSRHGRGDSPYYFWARRRQRHGGWRNGVCRRSGVRVFWTRRERRLAPETVSRGEHYDLQGCDPRISGIRIEVACDVDNPLVGPRAARRRYSVAERGDA